MFPSIPSPQLRHLHSETSIPGPRSGDLESETWIPRPRVRDPETSNLGPRLREPRSRDLDPTTTISRPRLPTETPPRYPRCDPLGLRFNAMNSSGRGVRLRIMFHTGLAKHSGPVTPAYWRTHGSHQRSPDKASGRWEKFLGLRTAWRWCI